MKTNLLSPSAVLSLTVRSVASATPTCRRAEIFIAVKAKSETDLNTSVPLPMRGLTAR
ncbi:hypothetical protein PGB90_008051 [Kerria lacca]